MFHTFSSDFNRLQQITFIPENCKIFPDFPKILKIQQIFKYIKQIKEFFRHSIYTWNSRKTLRFSSNSLEIQTDFVKTLKYFWKCDISKVHKISRNVQVISQTFLKPPGKSNRFLSIYYTDPSIFLQKF